MEDQRAGDVSGRPRSLGAVVTRVRGWMGSEKVDSDFRGLLCRKGSLLQAQRAARDPFSPS